MKEVLCPQCGSDSLRHHTDAYVVRRPIINDEGRLELTDERTDEYDDYFFACEDCWYRPAENELLLSANGEGAGNPG
jgi:hypothetical protein